MNGARPTVLQVLPSLDGGGVERGTVEMAQAVARAGGTALVASAGGRLVGAIEREGGAHVTMALDSKNPLVVWRNAARLAALIRARDVTIVHARSRAPAWAAWLAARRTGRHFVTTYHGAYGEDLPFKRHYNAVMAKGEIVIAASRFIAALVQARHGVDPRRIRVIPRGVDPDVFDPAAVTPARLIRLARTWRLPDGFTTILLPGRVTRWKGHEVLIEAVARLSRADVCVALVGADQGRHRYAAELGARAQARGLGDRVRLIGHCDDMPAAMMLSDIVVNPSIAPEAFGRVVIEAQAMGRPIIAADHGGAAETIADGITGFRVRPGDPAALAQALEAVLAMPAPARAALGEAARASVRRHYTTASMQAATLDVYDTLLR